MVIQGFHDGFHDGFHKAESFFFGLLDDVFTNHIVLLVYKPQVWVYLHIKHS
jgi:hypothetical protein